MGQRGGPTPAIFVLYNPKIVDCRPVRAPVYYYVDRGMNVTESNPIRETREENLRIPSALKPRFVVEENKIYVLNIEACAPAFPVRSHAPCLLL